MERVLAVILAGGAGERLSVLSAKRAKPALPFAGKYRLIDFTLSNCVNSDIDNVLVLAQYQPRSLVEHIGIGRAWDLDRLRGGGLKVLQPYLSLGGSEWYHGTADAVRYNLEDIDRERRELELVLILAGDHVYKMDYRPLLAAHRASGAEVTVAVHPVPREEASRMGVCTLDENGFVTDWEEKPSEPKSTLASMGVYVFSRRALRRWLSAERHDFGQDVIPAMLAAGARVFGYRWEGYWRDVGTLDAYWAANLDLVALVPPLDLFDPAWLIHTPSEERSSAKLGPQALVQHALVSHGCLVNGQVTNSVLSPGVLVADGAVVRDSVLLLDVEIGPGAVVDTAIVDRGARIGAGAQVGVGDKFETPNVDQPDYLNQGITVVGADAFIPEGMIIGRNCRLDPEVTASDFADDFVPSGASVRHHPRPDQAEEVNEGLGVADRQRNGEQGSA